MRKDFIYIIGKTDPQAEFLEAIHRLGYRAGVLLDVNASLKHPEGYDRIESVDFSKLDDELSRLDSLELSVAGIVCTYENYVISKAKLGAHFNVAAPSLLSAQMSTDKLLMRQAFMNKDPSITPHFTTVDLLGDALRFAEERGYPLIIKPTNLVKSLLVLRCNDEAELIANFTYAHDSVAGLYEQYNIYDREPQLIIEEYITGKTCSIAAFVDDEGIAHFCEGIASITSAQEIGADDNYLYSRQLPAPFSDALTARCFEVAKAGIEALDMRSTPAHVELIYKDNDVKLIEIGARIGGYRPRMYDFSYGLDLIEQEVKLSIKKVPSLAGAFKAYSAVFELFPKSEGSFVAIAGGPNVNDYTYYSAKVRPGQKVGPAKNGYKASLIVIVVHEDYDAFNRLCSSVDGLGITVSPIE